MSRKKERVWDRYMLRKKKKKERKKESEIDIC